MNIDLSSMFSGVVEGVGARYCPSIEDKIVRFADKNRHQVFLEPESVHLNTTYAQGLSSSLPEDVQDKMIRTVPGLENCVIQQYGYAIEYDALDPIQLKPNLELMSVKNLFTAGQVNGTSGYEEAAGQGIMAGINASLKNMNQEPFILGRDEAYIGVMIDDLVTKGTQEPYRLLTSRAEYRLLLRHDNAYRRLSPYGHQMGLISEANYEIIKTELETIDQFISEYKMMKLPRTEAVKAYFDEKNSPFDAHDLTLFDAIKRPGINLVDLVEILDLALDHHLIFQAEVDIKYEGYIQKAIREAEKLQAMEKIKLPDHLDYHEIDNLSIEGRQKLTQIRPLTIGQASRISGVNPADISILAMVLKTKEMQK